MLFVFVFVLLFDLFIIFSSDKLFWMVLWI